MTVGFWDFPAGGAIAITTLGKKLFLSVLLDVMNLNLLPKDSGIKMALPGWEQCFAILFLYSGRVNRVWIR